MLESTFPPNLLKNNLSPVKEAIMKTILPIVWACLCMLSSVYAQVPQGITYQAVVRDNNGGIRANQSVMLGLSIRQGSPTGVIVYEEDHNVSTNNLGVVNLIVGRGTSSQDFSDIDWTQGALFVEIELDGQVMGTTPLLTVPYAFHAETVEEVQEISKSGSTVSLSKGGGSFTDEVDDADSDPGNEIQTLSLSGDNLILSQGGGSVVLPGSSSSIRTISFPAKALNHSSSSSIILNDGAGLKWTNSFSASALISIRRPADYSGGTVKFYIFFRTTSSTAGTVIFFIRPRSYNSTDGYGDAANLSTNEVNVSGTEGFGTLYEQSYNIPATRLTNDWWQIGIQRDSNSNTYTDDVIVHSVALEYTAN